MIIDNSGEQQEKERGKDMNSRQRFILVLAVMFLLAPVFSAWTDQPQAKPTVEDTNAKPTSSEAPAVIPEGEQEEDLAVSGFIDSLWMKVRSIMISEEEVAKGDEPRYSATAGIRGAKSSDDILKPIWKGKDKKAHLPADARLFEKAKEQFEKADYQSAVSSLTEFQKVFKYSQLKPQAEIILALSYAKTGNQEMAVKTLDNFLKAYPNHKLKADVKQLKENMAKGASE